MENGLAPSVSSHRKHSVCSELSQEWSCKMCGQGRREREGSTKAQLMCSLEAVKFVNFTKFALEEVSVESVTVLQPHPGGGGGGGGSGCQQSHAGFDHTSPAQAASLCTLRKATYRCQDTEPQTALANLNPSVPFVLWEFSLYMSEA